VRACVCACACVREFVCGITLLCADCVEAPGSGLGFRVQGSGLKALGFRLFRGLGFRLTNVVKALCVQHDLVVILACVCVCVCVCGWVGGWVGGWFVCGLRK
jgi:hypothetical protein